MIFGLEKIFLTNSWVLCKEAVCWICHSDSKFSGFVIPMAISRSECFNAHFVRHGKCSNSRLLYQHAKSCYICSCHSSYTIAVASQGKATLELYSHFHVFVLTAFI